eukprot:1468634-Rhodomonas_salina.4
MQCPVLTQFMQIVLRIRCAIPGTEIVCFRCQVFDTIEEAFVFVDTDGNGQITKVGVSSYAYAMRFPGIRLVLSRGYTTMSGTDLAYGATPKVEFQRGFWRLGMRVGLPLLSSYAPATRCPVLTSGMLLPGRGHYQARDDAGGRRQYQRSGQLPCHPTPYQPTCPLRHVFLRRFAWHDVKVSSAIALRAGYAMSGTHIDYAGYAMSGHVTHTGYAATRAWRRASLPRRSAFPQMRSASKPPPPPT